MVSWFWNSDKGKEAAMKNARTWAAVLVTVSAVCMAEGDAWFPFVISYGGADNASSVAHMLDAPAGKHGFVRVAGGEFVTDAGPIRFNGTNITGPANFPEHATAAVGDGSRARVRLSPVLQTLWYEVAIKSTRKEKRSGEERQQ